MAAGEPARGCGKEQGCWGQAGSCGPLLLDLQSRAGETESYQKQSKTSSSAPSPAAHPSSSGPNAGAMPGRGGGVGKAGQAPASCILLGQRQSTGTARGSYTYPRPGADRHSGSEHAQHGIRAPTARLGAWHSVLALRQPLPGSCLLSPVPATGKLLRGHPAIWQAGAQGAASLRSAFV